MGMLPPEVFAMILSYVQDDRKVLRAMNAMCKVSRLEVQPLLWRDIETGTDYLELIRVCRIISRNPQIARHVRRFCVQDFPQGPMLWHAVFLLVERTLHAMRRLETLELYPWVLMDIGWMLPLPAPFRLRTFKYNFVPDRYSQAFINSQPSITTFEFAQPFRWGAPAEYYKSTLPYVEDICGNFDAVYALAHKRPAHTIRMTVPVMDRSNCDEIIPYFKHVRKLDIGITGLDPYILQVLTENCPDIQILAIRVKPIQLGSLPRNVIAMSKPLWGSSLGKFKKLTELSILLIPPLAFDPKSTMEIAPYLPKEDVLSEWHFFCPTLRKIGIWLSASVEYHNYNEPRQVYEEHWILKNDVWQVDRIPIKGFSLPIPRRRV